MTVERNKTLDPQRTLNQDGNKHVNQGFYTQLMFLFVCLPGFTFLSLFQVGLVQIYPLTNPGNVPLAWS